MASIPLTFSMAALEFRYLKIIVNFIGNRRSALKPCGKKPCYAENKGNTSTLAADAAEERENYSLLLTVEWRAPQA
jgi:hypothetical protein